jgi:two-component system, cell cycle sensor histidine kinase and response regulator CckA
MSLRSMSEQAAAISPEQLALLLDSPRGFSLLMDAQGNVQFVSEGILRLLGFTAKELLGNPFFSLMHPRDAQEVVDRLSEVSATGREALERRCRLQGRDGSCRWFDVSVRKGTGAAGSGAWVMHFQDVTDLRRMEEERQVNSEIVQALNQTLNLDELLAGIHQALKKVVPAENCFVALHDTATDRFSFPFFVDQVDPAPPPPQRAGRSCTAYVFRKGVPMLIPQREFDRLATAGEVELVGAPSPSWLGVPLKTPTATIGVLVVQHYENEKAYDQRDLEFLGSVGGHIALAIERRRAEEDLRKKEEMFRLLFTHNPLPTWVIDQETLRFLEVNEAAIQVYGFSQEEFRGMTTLDLRSEKEKARLLDYLQRNSSEELHHGQWEHRKKDGKNIQVETTVHELEHEGKKIRLIVAQDVSQRHILEQQLRQSQKMEAVGRLAGGVAHDFNNLLMVIKGHTELLHNALPPGEEFSRKIEQIERAADRASALTRQLLAFSRLQVLQPRVMNLNEVVKDMGRLLPRLIGEDIELDIRAAEDLGALRADVSQMEQIIMNLVVNSRDAMPEGGRLLIETSNAELDGNYSAKHPMVRAGHYVLLSVTDTGTGMDAETQAHIFEPFFTTKAQGKGTGLGLATVYGVVKQSGGFIWVYSELGRGTTFKIYFPRVDELVDRASPTAPAAEIPQGTETILLTEDEQDVREVTREFLESGGYRVLEAHDGMEALAMVEKHQGDIDLLITDMVMPRMTGEELAARLKEQRPQLRMLYMSGYSEKRVAQPLAGDPSARLLVKPFSRSALLWAVHELLSLKSRKL